MKHKYFRFRFMLSLIILDYSAIITFDYVSHLRSAVISIFIHSLETIQMLHYCDISMR